jgi:hypothetical protein
MPLPLRISLRIAHPSFRVKLEGVGEGYGIGVVKVDSRIDDCLSIFGQ